MCLNNKTVDDDFRANHSDQILLIFQSCFYTIDVYEFNITRKLYSNARPFINIQPVSKITITSIIQNKNVSMRDKTIYVHECDPATLPS